jgi:hypothetical protein
MSQHPIEVMRQALEALEVAYGVSLIEDIIPKDAPIKQAITALRSAIEQAEKRVQLTVRDFVVTVGGIEDAVGEPVYWAEWPNRENT